MGTEREGKAHVPQVLLKWEFLQVLSNFWVTKAGGKIDFSVCLLAGVTVPGDVGIQHTLLLRFSLS